MGYPRDWINIGRDSQWLVKSAALYLSPIFDLSKIISVRTPRLCASTRASAMGFEVKEYAWTRISFFAYGIDELRF
jgi:hypothetical protein